MEIQILKGNHRYIHTTPHHTTSHHTPSALGLEDYQLSSIADTGLHQISLQLAILTLEPCMIRMEGIMKIRTGQIRRKERRKGKEKKTGQISREERRRGKEKRTEQIGREERRSKESRRG